MSFATTTWPSSEQAQQVKRPGAIRAFVVYFFAFSRATQYSSAMIKP